MDRAQIYALPEQELIIRHICVEGWDYIGQWSGPNLRQFLERIGADTKAKYVAFNCADNYTETLDMATALHPQTILATKYAKQPITDPFGFPLRLRAPTKLGFKSAKWITAIEVTNTFTKRSGRSRASTGSRAYSVAHDLFRKPVPSPIGVEDMLFGIMR